MEEVLNQLDTDHSGRIEMNEFVEWWSQRSIKSRSGIFMNRYAYTNYIFMCSIFKDMYVRKHMFMCTHYIHIYTYTLIYIYMYIYNICIYIQIFIYINVCICIYIYIHIYMYIYIYIYAYIHTGGGLIAIKLRKLARKAAQLFFTDIFTAVWNNDINLVKLFVESDSRIGIQYFNVRCVMIIHSKFYTHALFVLTQYIS
jgi:hypothetical protein